MKCAQNTAHNSKFENMGLSRHPFGGILNKLIRTSDVDEGGLYLTNRPTTPSPSIAPTHWGRMVYTCASKLYTAPLVQILNQCWIVINWSIENRFQWELIKMKWFSYKKINRIMSSTTWRPFCLSLNVFIPSTCRRLGLQNDHVARQGMFFDIDEFYKHGSGRGGDFRFGRLFHTCDRVCGMYAISRDEGACVCAGWSCGGGVILW